MAQRSNKRQPVYSADALAMRFLAGLALVALGVMMFLAVEMRMTGNVFDALRQVCYGVFGGLAPAAPALPIWAGVLVIISASRKAPVRPWLWTMTAFAALSAFIVIVTRIGREEYLVMLAGNAGGSWAGLIRQGYQRSIELKASGGALGIALAFPFRTLVGPILGAVLLFLAMILCVLTAVGLSPARIRDLMTGKVVIRWGRKPKEQEAQDLRQIAWQQEQERQRQAYEQQQAYILQQQEAARRNAQQQNAVQQAAAEQTRAGTAQQPAMTDNSVLDWQMQLTGSPEIPNQTGRSQIFGGNRAEGSSSSRQSALFGGGRSQGGPQNQGTSGFSRIQAREQEQPKAGSWIFGRKKNREDGLCDLSPEEKARAGTAASVSGGVRNPGTVRRTVNGAEIGQPETRWNAADGDAEVRQVYDEAARTSRSRKQERQADGEPERGEIRPASEEAARRQEASEDDGLDRWRRPAETREEAPQPEQFPDSGSLSAAEPKASGAGRPGGSAAARRDSAATVSAAGEDGMEVSSSLRRSQKERKKNDGVKSPWLEQVEARVGAGEQTQQPVQVKSPAVQETIADPTWKPELKGVAPKAETEEDAYWEPTPYIAPPITDLKRPAVSTENTAAEDEARSRRLEQILANFKVQARVVHVTHGPAISRFEMELAPGTKVGKVAELERDIAYGMEATSVRIEAPIPGKSLVGVEVPNPKRALVTLREILESPQMQKGQEKSLLTVALGKDIAGTPIVCDLAKMPHMLIAGATGSGKSVCINTIINSLLFNAGPDEVKMILVDPKVVELQCYNGLPHLLLPVVNDPHKAAAALAWAVAEMMERYDKFAERKVRNLDGYNSVLGPGEKPMPRIVIIIDELADLMMVCKKDVEEYICRLTQLARAAGIHLIVATQRPSVDVITGLIKANIPSRIAFKTASYVDSRTILDRNGSEQLLGNGDMLYLPTGAFAPTRIQGCFLSDEEVNRIADHVRQANPSTYDPDILDKLEQLSRGTDEAPTMDMIGGAADPGSGDAELFERAVEIAIADGQVSTSTLQRRLKVGYARAGRLTDEMEERGIVSAKDGSKPRKTLITREEWENIRTAAQ